MIFGENFQESNNKAIQDTEQLEPILSCAVSICTQLNIRERLSANRNLFEEFDSVIKVDIDVGIAGL